MKVSVCVPNYRHPELTEEFCRSFFQTTDFERWEMELVLCDDASKSPELTQVLESWRDRHPNIVKLVVREKNGGFPGATNSAIAASTGDYIVCTSNDVRFVDKQWTEALLKPHLVGKKCITGGQYVNYNSLTFVDGHVIDYVNGWLMVFPRQFLTDLASVQTPSDQVFMEQFAPGYFEDVTLSFYAKYLLGYELIAPPNIELPDCYMIHIGGQTINQQTSPVHAIAMRNQLNFREIVRQEVAKHNLQLP